MIFTQQLSLVYRLSCPGAGIIFATEPRWPAVKPGFAFAKFMNQGLCEVQRFSPFLSGRRVPFQKGAASLKVSETSGIEGKRGPLSISHPDTYLHVSSRNVLHQFIPKAAMKQIGLGREPKAHSRGRKENELRCQVLSQPFYTWFATEAPQPYQRNSIKSV